MAVALLCLLTTVICAFDCTGVDPGYYCLDEHDFIWCYGRTDPLELTCPVNTVCKCGKTVYNPCAWDFQEVPECDGEPGEYFKPETSSESEPESSSEPEPEPESSSEPEPEPESSSEPEPEPESSSEPEPEPESSSEPEPEPESSSEPEPEPESSSEPEPSSESQSESGPKKIVSYYTNWSQYRSNSIDGWACKFTPDLIDPTVLDVINYAFVVFDDTYTVKEYEWNDDQMIPQVVSKKQVNPDLKILCAIGGWNFNLYESTKYLFSEMSEFKAGRTTFIKSAISFAKKYNLDGIDIDWEYPGNEDQGGREVDTVSFTSLLKEFREAIDEDASAGNKKLLLTIAAPAGPKNIEKIEISEIHKYLDWINVMTYDLHGAWDSVTGSHTALFADDGLSVDDAITIYLNAGVPASKLFLGMGHYGRGWTLKSSSDHEMGSPAIGASSAGTCTREDGYMAKYELDAFLPESNIVYDEKTMTMYGWNDDQFFSFDDSTTFALKAEYLCAKNLGGAMIWAIDLDKNLVETRKIREKIDEC
ncbi:Chitotriosidase-1 [Entamoeba marina]